MNSTLPLADVQRYGARSERRGHVRRPSMFSPRMLREIVREALQGLYHHRLRAGLSMLGISWGIVSVVMLLAYGNGFHAAIAYGMSGAFGDGTVVLWPGQTSMQAGGERSGTRVRLAVADAEALEALPLVKFASPEFVERLPIAYGEKLATYAIRGVNPAYGVMRSERAAKGQGRFLNTEDIDQRRRVVFLGSEIRRKLFGARTAVGERVRIAGMPFEVVGVMEEKVQMSTYFSPDKLSAFIPYTTMSQLSDTRYLDTLVFQTVDPLLQVRALGQMREELARRHRYNPADERAIIVEDSVETGKIIGGITGGLKLVLSFIGILTLAIGGVGIMNIMFVSVQERTREIGIRKALGARRREILTQFLLEALVTTFLGGLIGVAASFLFVWIGSPRPFLADLLDDPTGLTDIHLLLTTQLITICTGILVVIGLVSGFLPALRAARMDPIEALRYE